MEESKMRDWENEYRRRPKNRPASALEPLYPGRQRSLGEVRRELRERHARRVAQAWKLGIDATGLTADDLDEMIRSFVVEHEVEG